MAQRSILSHRLQLLMPALIVPLLLICGCAQLPPATSSSTNTNAELPAQIEKLLLLQKNLIQQEVTGSNMALVVRDGEVIHREVVNSGKKGDKDITDETLFPIWSMSKPITIVAMMTLHEKGLFDWNDPVAKYIPCFENLTVQDGDQIRPANAPLRIEHLMAHRSGYGYYTPWPDVPPMGMTNPPSYDHPHTTQTRFDNLQQLCEVAAATPLAFDPGAGFLYGINQALLGRLVEVLSGKSFASYLAETIFQPLGMTRTSFVLTEQDRPNFQPLFIHSGDLKGYTDLLNELTYSPRSEAHFGGEGLISSVEDYSRFCEMLAGRGVFRGQRIISEESLQAMTTVKSELPFGAAWPSYDMGYSLFILKNPALEGSQAPEGCFGWSGYHNTHFWIDPENQLYALFMTRAREFDFELAAKMRAAVYGEAP